MKITILSVGSLKSGPEKQIFEDYADRFRKTGRQVGLRALTDISVTSGPDMAGEAEKLRRKIPSGARILRLDEAGEGIASAALARRIGAWRDQGTPDLVLVIGGAEGFDEAFAGDYPDALALGPQTWPHRLVKIMLSEQLYRAATLLAGVPYHKA